MDTISSAPAQGMQQIDLTKLSLQQLTQLKQQVDQVSQEFTVNYGVELFSRFTTNPQSSADQIRRFWRKHRKITPQTKGKTILVPLTGSIYVPGTISDTENVIIDIGTGYYAQKDIASARDYFKRKVDFVTEQMEKIQALGIEKSKIRDAICDVMERKLQSQVAAQKSAAAS